MSDALGRMSEMPPVIYLAQHGETDWTLTGQHAGLVDLPLTERGARRAQRLGGTACISSASDLFKS